MSTLKPVQLKKSAPWLRDIPKTELLPDGQGKGGFKNIFSVGFPRSRTVNERYIIYYG